MFFLFFFVPTQELFTFYVFLVYRLYNHIHDAAVGMAKCGGGVVDDSFVADRVVFENVS